jgi:hypothetical protein
MECHRVKNRLRQMLVRHAFPIAIVGSLLSASLVAFGQHLAGGRSGGFSGAHVGDFPGTGFQRSFSAPRSFSGFSGPVPRVLSAAPRMNWTAPHDDFAPGRKSFTGYRPAYGTGDRGGDYCEHYGRPYRGYVYGGYLYVYASWRELLPWDIGYPDIIGYEDDNEAPEQNNAQTRPSGEESNSLRR